MYVRRAIWLGLAVVMVASSGVAASDASPSPAPLSTPSDGPSAQATSSPDVIDVTAFLPAGTYAADVPAGLEGAPGTWTMTIETAGFTWTNPLTGVTFSPGDVVEVTDTTVVFAPDVECPDQSSPTAGTYTWQVDADGLRFSAVSDSCLGRRDTLASAPWVPVP